MAPAKPSALVDTRVIYCGDNLEQLRKLPAACVDLIYIDPPTPDVDAFEAMMMRENCDTGFFVSFAYSSDAMTEIGQFFKRTGKMIRAFTVRDILDEELGRKLA